MTNPLEARRNFGRRFAVGCIALLALVLLAAACNPSDALQYDEATSTLAPAATVSDETGGGGDSRSPLFDLIGVPLDNDEAIEDYYNELYAQVEHQITECMVAQGFEYTPLGYSTLDLTADPIVDTREFAEEFGFGIASLEEGADVPAGMIQEVDDPNIAYRDSLTAGESEAFDLALFGGGNGSEPGGCQHEAFEEAFAFVVVFEEFGFDFEGVQDIVNADPRIIEAQSQWGVCMAQTGYAYSDRADAESDIQERLGYLLDDQGAFAGGSLNSEVERQIDKLAAEERATAVASWECTEPISKLKRIVERENEQRFADDHGGAIRTALESTTEG